MTHANCPHRSAYFWAVLLLLSGATAGLQAGEPAASRFEIIARQSVAALADAELAVETVDAAETSRLLPVRVVVTASDGNHPDGSGHGAYADGRFFADGKFSVCVPPGRTKLRVASGPDYLPLEMVVDAKAGERLALRVHLVCWFSPRQHGWFGGDNHVHAQHDAVADIKTDVEFAALQARADGLSFVTEAGPQELSAAELQRLSRPDFVMLHAAELKRSCFVGHLNTPGITQALGERFEQLIRRPLPVQAITEVVHELGGLTIHTHPLTPRHQLHWMGATEIYSDAVLGRCADALDTDSPATELLRFAVLNLGNRPAVSSYTDCDLGRRHTLSPGDRRVYCHADTLSAAALVQAFREGHTFATDGGPLFAFFTIDGRQPGDTIRFDGEQRSTARVEIHHRRPLKTVELYRRGNRVKTFDCPGDQGELVLTHQIHEQEMSWYTVRAEDADGHWAVTSPIYFEPRQPPPRPASSALLLEISNASRYVTLQHDFFAHVLATVSPDQQWAEIQLLKDGTVIRSFKPAEGNHLATPDKVPVSSRDGDYAPGWVWFPEPGHAGHFQADCLVTTGGWYALRAITVAGRSWESDAIHFDSANPNSQEISMANLRGGDTQFTLWGYGEEMPLAEVQRSTAGDHWYYPSNMFWRLSARFAGELHEQHGGNDAMTQLFKKAE